MTTIDIPVSEAIQRALDLPPCEAIKIPMPTPLKVQLPNGLTLQAFTDLSKGIPNDCSMTFNLMLQLAPLLAAIECPIRVLKVIDKLKGVLEGLPKLDFGKIPECIDAIVELAPCIASIAGIPKMATDVLCLIRKVLNCILGQLRSIRDLLGGLQLRFAAAEGNDDLLAVLECAKENANTQLANVTQAIEPVSAVLNLVGPFLEIAGLPKISLESPGAAPEDLAGLDAVVDALQAVVDAIDAVPGVDCG